MTLRRLSTHPQPQRQPAPAREEGVAERAGLGRRSGSRVRQGDGTAAAAAAVVDDLPAPVSGGGADAAALGDVWRLVRVARPEAGWLALALALLIVTSGVAMSIPYAIGKIVDNASAPEPQRVLGLTMNQFLLGFAGLLTVSALANFGSIVVLRVVGERVIAKLRCQLYRRTFVQDAEFFDANRLGDIISRLGSDTVIVGKSVTSNLSSGIGSVFTASAGLAIMAWTSAKLTGLLLLIAPPAAVGVFFYGRAVRGVSLAIQKSLGALTKIADERLGSIKTSQAFAAEAQEVRRYSDQVRTMFALGRRESLINATFFASSEWLGDVTILAVLVVGGNLVGSGAMSVGDLTSFMFYALFTGHSLHGISSFYSDLMKGAGAATRLFELQDRQPAIYHTVGQPVKSAKGPVRFHNVDFAYPTRPETPIFRGLDFEIPSGSSVCIVGPSGGGKSTIASLLLRFYNPCAGVVTIDGVDISKLNVQSLRRRIGIVAQEPVLFSATIAENIAYGKPGAGRLEILEAARKANCDFVNSLPKGLETQVGPHGSQLSGGQKQRVAIARALLKAPDILILDEATSALDTESEALFNEALEALLRGQMTTISIAHRLSTIQRSDQVVVLNEEGRVAEIGSYTQLASDGTSAFSKLMERQMMRGKDARGSSVAGGGGSAVGRGC